MTDDDQLGTLALGAFVISQCGQLKLEGPVIRRLEAYTFLLG